MSRPGPALPCPSLAAAGTLRILVFSGDVDGILPVVGTRRWVAGLGLRTLKAWRPWFSKTGQVAGHVVEYDQSLTFASVRNAGHMVSWEVLISCGYKWLHPAGSFMRCERSKAALPWPPPVQVPYVQPERMFHLMTAFLNGEAP